MRYVIMIESDRSLDFFLLYAASRGSLRYGSASIERAEDGTWLFASPDDAHLMPLRLSRFNVSLVQTDDEKPLT